jgi:hypothetical protein
MSKRINVNPDHYKGAGRERPGDARPKTPKQRARVRKSGRPDATVPARRGTAAKKGFRT